MSICFKTVYFPENRGHGDARRASLANCSFNLVALMDADDISLPDRFEKQIPLFLAEPETAVVGGQITEFVGSPEHITGRRIVPERDAEIKAYMKKRCPMNQVTVAFRKDAVQNAGGYLDWFCEEDYYLWIRLALAGEVFRNVPDTLVNVRTGEGMAARRGGWRYFRSEAGIQKLMLDKKLISVPRYLYNVLIRFGGEVMVPDRLRTGLFRFLREKNTPAADRAEPDVNAGSRNGDGLPPFSVAMCVYGGDRPEWFDSALNSIVRQTLRPAEIVLVVDGPIPSGLQEVIRKYETICNGESV